MINRLSILTFTLIILTACKSITIDSKNQIEIPKTTKQILFVRTKDWSSKIGTLQRYEKDNGKWHKVGDTISIILGRNGLAWGRGLHKIPKDATNIKREGDGKAPAGLFSLKNGFGYAPLKIDFPYSVYKRSDHCVDDSNSKWYNRIIDSTKVDRDYKSFEHMKLNNNQYEYGLVVNHNPNGIKMGGSCIFMHIRSGDGAGTAGCTAMSRDNIIKILKWIKKEDNPLLLQLPQSEIKRVKLSITPP